MDAIPTMGSPNEACAERAIMHHDAAHAHVEHLTDDLLRLEPTRLHLVAVLTLKVPLEGT